MSFMVNVSWCGDHHKSPPTPPIDGALHTRWLYESFVQVPPYSNTIVTAPGFAGIMTVDNKEEKEYLWRVFDICKMFIGHAVNPGHRKGCCLAIQMGIEAAFAKGFDYLITTAEDVVPNKGAISYYVEKLSEYDYVGSFKNPDDGSLNTQFFGCRASKSLASVWDYNEVGTDPNYMDAEAYMRTCMKRINGRVFVTSKEKCEYGVYNPWNLTAYNDYFTSHDYAEWSKIRYIVG